MNVSRLRPLTIAMALALSAAPAAAQEFGTLANKDLRNQHADLTSVVSSRNVDQMKRAWMVSTGKNPVSHMPLVHNERVYFGDWGGYVYSVDASTGEVLWKKQVEDQVQMMWPWHGIAGTGAIAAPEGLYVVASVEGTAWGIDLNTGEVRWEKSIADDPQAGSLAKITYHDGLVYLGLQSVEEPLSAAKPDIQIDFRGKVLALNAATGDLVWERWLVTPPHNGVAVWSGFALDPELNALYFTTGNNYTGEATELSDALVAVDAGTGEIRWHRQVTEHDIWTKRDPKGPDYDFGAAPQLWGAVIDGVQRQLVGAGQKSGIFYVWDRVTGEKIWTHTVGYGHIGGGIHGEGSVGADRILLWGNNAFPYKNPAQHPLDIKAVDKATGKLLWVIPRAQPALQISAGFLANDVYFIGSMDGMVRAYRVDDGTKLWTSQPHGAVASSVWVEGGLLLWGGSVPLTWDGAAEPNGVFAYSIYADGPRAATGAPPMERQPLQVRKDDGR